MSLGQHELFQKLLQQIHFEDLQNEAFAEASIQQVVVHRQSKTWEFHFHFQNVLPFDLFSQFTTQLKLGFADVATVNWQISTEMERLDQRLIADYWRYVISNSGLSSPMLQELCSRGVPNVTDDRVMFVAENEIVRNYLVNQALGPIETGTGI